ncbi:uncharacterized protein LOC9658460 [Selaginella moellendorffii]|uniref:uncharacterized protein LOC9658460 n=1 Tax=Selaginella moellendorffii TaxID=88036 RepID=UPI000D1C525A|nr:uncharacterized protein LOC9658460 [Selaginella moellendorffii]XP_024525517.1 uncharacterized protein LOC9658460 [Selaginella moellendorffii]|eukprot:XP_024525516.1 uncharacterized protein LOC9658460 [Selaginella moellendorffii]
MALALFHHNPVAAACASLRSSCANRRRQNPLCHATILSSSHSSRAFNNRCKSKPCINKLLAMSCGTAKPCSGQLENETMKLARRAFCEEVTRKENVSLAKAALLISIEDEAFIMANRERDMAALQKEGRSVFPHTKIYPTDALYLEGQSIAHWLDKLDSLVKTSQHPMEVLKTFTKKSSLTTDPSNFYLHQVLSLGAGTAIMLGILYMELSRRMGLPVSGAPVGDDFLVWPSTENNVISGGDSVETGLSAEMVFEPFKGGKIWSKKSDGSYVRQHSSAASGPQAGPHPTSGLRPVSDQAILSVLLRKLKRLYWKRAAKAYAGCDIAAPLHPLALATAQGVPLLSLGKEQTLLRPQDLRLAVAASEKLLLLQRDWITRRDHGLLLYHSRRYGEALQELSACLAVAPVHDLQILEPFVEKLHLLRVESSWAASLNS